MKRINEDLLIKVDLETIDGDPVLSYFHDTIFKNIENIILKPNEYQDWVFTSNHGVQFIIASDKDFKRKAYIILPRFDERDLWFKPADDDSDFLSIQMQFLSFCEDHNYEPASIRCNAYSSDFIKLMKENDEQYYCSKCWLDNVAFEQDEISFEAPYIEYNPAWAEEIKLYL